MKAFMLTFTPAYLPGSVRSRVATADALVRFIDTRPEFLNWYSFANAGLFVVSEKSAQELAVILHEQFPGALFLIAQIDARLAGGWLPQKAWEFISTPRSSGRWK